MSPRRRPCRCGCSASAGAVPVFPAGTLRSGKVRCRDAFAGCPRSGQVPATSTSVGLGPIAIRGTRGGLRDSPAGATETTTIRVLIADDQALFRRGLYVVLGTEEHIEVVAEAADGEEAIALAAELVPDVVLMDVRLPRINGIDAARRIRQDNPGTKVVMLTVSDDEEDLYEAVKAGANGYLLKEISVEEVAKAIRVVVRGQSLISPTMASKLLTEFNNLAKKAEERQQYPTPTLTTRELEVLKLVAKGMSNREIADALYISENTVKNHVRNILEKLHLHSRMEAVIYAVRERLLDIRSAAD
jgi:DNA-binding NarL/FixJ family response regulator